MDEPAVVRHQAALIIKRPTALIDEERIAAAHARIAVGLPVFTATDVGQEDVLDAVPGEVVNHAFKGTVTVVGQRALVETAGPIVDVQVAALAGGEEQLVESI